MNPPTHPWIKLTALARRAPDDRAEAAPFGFATRVTARAATLPAANPWAVYERFAVRGLMLAAGLSLAAVAFNYTSSRASADDDFGVTDSVTELLAIS